MRNIRATVVTSLMVWCASTAAFDPQLDMKSVEVIGRGQCPYKEQVYPCFLVKKVDKYFVAVVDSEGFLAIYEVNGHKQNYSKEDAKLLWEREVPHQRRLSDMV